MILLYGNKYVTNEEEWNKEKPSDKDMFTATLDYLQTQEEYFRDENDKLPEDWFDTVFWREEK